MTREMIEKDIFEFIKSDYEKFVLELKTNGNYDFFKTLDNFTQRMAFLKSINSHGIDWYRDYVYNAIFGYSYRITKSFTLKHQHCPFPFPSEDRFALTPLHSCRP